MHHVYGQTQNSNYSVICSFIRYNFQIAEAAKTWHFSSFYVRTVSSNNPKLRSWCWCRACFLRIAVLIPNKQNTVYYELSSSSCTTCQWTYYRLQISSVGGWSSPSKQGLAQELMDTLTASTCLYESITSSVHKQPTIIVFLNFRRLLMMTEGTF